MQPLIIPRAEHNISRRDISPEALKVLYRLNECGFLAYLAGGGVRDLLLGRKPKDFDVVTDATPKQLRRVFRNCRLIGRRFRLAHVFFGDRIIEVATFRSNRMPEEEPADGSQRHQVRTEDGLIVRDNLFGTPEEDAVRRDFTINALFYNIRDRSVIDYVGGLADLRARVLRFIGDPATRCREDPVRMVRAVRFAAALGFDIAPETAAALRELSERLALANQSRLYEEVLKLFFCGAAEQAYSHLREFGLFELLFPEMGAWLGPQTDTPECRRIREAMRQVDMWRQAGREVTPALLFALLFGGMHEARAASLAAQGHHPGLALHSAALEHFGALNERIRVPNSVRYRTAEILACQPRLVRDGGTRAEPLRTREFFPEAVAYLEFTVRLTGQHREALERVRALAAEPLPRRPSGRRRRPRRRFRPRQ